MPDPEWGDALLMIDARTVPLSRVLKQGGDTIMYKYDFSDSWRHDLLLEVILSANPERASLVCVAGTRARPPEDVGSVWGYPDFLQAIADPTHVEHEAMLTWVGGAFDPEGCDVNMVNRQLQRLR